MNLFINILFVYFLPILLYTLGKNEYLENADEHRLSQRNSYNTEETNAVNCTEYRVAIELNTITKEDYFYSVSGIIYGNDVVLYYQKTYDRREATEERIIENGKSISVKENQPFTIRTRDQGVLSLFLLAEDSLSHCRSNIVHIPVETLSEKKRNPMHLWSPQLIIQNDDCFVSFSMSTPAEVFFLLGHPSASELIKSSKEIISLGFYGGMFAEEASLYVGNLANSGEYGLWIVMKDDEMISQPYYYEFVIPKCFLPVTMDLLSTQSKGENEMELTLMIHSSQFPLVLFLYTESRDKHAIRPSLNTVIDRGLVFDVNSNGTKVINFQSTIAGNQLLWVAAKSKEGECLSNLHRFVYSPFVSSDKHPIYLSLPVVVPFYKSKNHNETSLVAFKMEGIIGFPEKITKTHQPFCEGYYSFTNDIPIPIKDRISLSIKHFQNDYLYSFSLSADDVMTWNENQILHISAEESITNQKHQFVSQADILECSSFIFTIAIKQSNTTLSLYGNVTDVAEIVQYSSDTLLSESISEIELLSMGTVVSYEMHHYFVLDVIADKIPSPKMKYLYFVARKGNCVSKFICIDAINSKYCS